MTGGLFLILATLVSTCIYFGVSVARKRSGTFGAFAQLCLIIFAICYVWSSLFEIWINGASLDDPKSLLHAFGPGQMPSLFLQRAVAWFIPAMLIAAISFGLVRVRIVNSRDDAEQQEEG
ncbi:hypothetical protein HW561_13490 [Rhodobacteraceae bacterium B1Z28]|uniref:Uncharacterized protein n=1 Tax=Ruegeria haliotis TaxID=2747601 RepID=A0ABX2PRM8_9RHOB|nr:hypothetical protein [Ruegeria haliotis]NVO56801.1 hypothetical protein [Ruegeria haliotis]